MNPTLTDAVSRINALLPAGFNSLDPLRNESIDRAVAVLIDSFSAAPEDERLQARTALSPESKLSLLGYAWQMAEDAVSHKAAEMIYDGLAALSIEDGEQDARDSIVRMGLLFRSAEKLRIAPNALFSKAADLAGRTTFREEMRGFPSRVPEDRDFSSLYRESYTQEGFRYTQQPWRGPKRRIIWRERLRKLLSRRA